MNVCRLTLSQQKFKSYFEGKVIRVKSIDSLKILTEKLHVKTEISSLRLLSCNRDWACIAGNLCVNTPSVLEECNSSDYFILLI